MPRRQQPNTPPGLPPIPSGAYKKGTIPTQIPCIIYKPPIIANDDEWSRGTISDQTQSTCLHQVVDDITAETYQVYVEYIRKRASWD